MAHEDEDRDVEPRAPRVPVAKRKRKRAAIGNLSRTGALLYLAERPPIGALVELNVAIGGAFTLVGAGEVVRHADEASAVGVAFIALEDESKRALDAMCAPRAAG
jgi:hypothetical protein